MTSVLKALQILFGLVGCVAGTVFVLTIVVGVPAFLVYIARIEPDVEREDAERKVRRINLRMFVFARRVLYIACASIGLSQLFGWLSGG